MALDVIRAQSARDAAAILDGNAGARFVGGGTLVVRQVSSGDASIHALVLSGQPDLDTIVIRGRRAEVGAAVTMAEIAAHAELAFLKPVAMEIGGPAVRAMATVGGNLFAPYPYGDFTVALLALNAEVAFETASGMETVDLDKFLVGGSTKARIVRSVSFDLPADGAFRFAKVMRRRPHGASVLSIAAVLPVKAGIVSGARVAYGAMSPRPMRARVVERVLESKPLYDDTIQRAVSVAAEGCAPQTDPFASDWYRLNVLPVHLKRLLESR
jgi:CO/xanthine dehydrogenase FAD-binding subunit